MLDVAPYSTSKDGVFSNLNAKPEIIRIDEVCCDKPPCYSQAVATMPPSYQDSVDELEILSGIVIDGLEVGNATIFCIHCLLGILFHVIGVTVGLILASSHAGRFGSTAAAGILLLLFSLTVEESNHFSPQVKPALSVILFVGGYVTFMASLFLFQRIQDRAKDAHRLSYTI